MNRTMKKDLVLSLLVIALVLSVVITFGDALYAGLWYYLLVLTVGLIAVTFFKPPALYHFGVTIGLALTLLFYLSVNYTADKPEGLLGLGHLYSLPGALMGSMIIAYRLKEATLWKGFVCGFVAILVGFVISQLLVCNALMWCGPFSISV